MIKLHIAENFSLPAEAVTQTFAILGIRGCGKTSTGVVMTEELLKAKQQVVIVDPVDVWWGLKSSKDGKQPGFALPVIGGDHADVLLDGAAGHVLADFVADTRASVILSLRHLSMHDQRRFAGDFAKRLYERKGQQRSPLMLMVDEADEFIPQRLPRGHEAMFGAFDRLVRRGRSSGIGVTLISQRAQVVNKDVLSQVETLVGMRVLHKLDRKALDAWIEAHDTEGKREEFLESLASLGRGDVWVWSPSWLNVFKRLHIRERETFDSSATPKAGELPPSPRELAPVDLDVLRAQMSAQIAKAKAEDPRELRAEIARLKKELAKAPAVAAAAAGPSEPEIRRHVEAEVRKALLPQFRGIRRHLESSMGAALLRLSDELGFLEDTRLDVRPTPVNRGTAPHHAPAEPVKSADAARPHMVNRGSGATSLGNPERRILTVLAQRPEGISDVSRLAILSGYTVNGHFNNVLGGLRTIGYVSEARVTPITITDAGKLTLGRFEPLPTGEALQDYWLSRLATPEQKVLRVLLTEYPVPIDLQELAGRAGYTVNGHFNNTMGSLRTKGLISEARLPIRAAQEFFE